MVWYIAVNGQPKEMLEEVLIYKIQNQEIASDTLVVNEEIKDWVPLKDTQLYRQYAPSDNTYRADTSNVSTKVEKKKPKKTGRMIMATILLVMGLFGIIRQAKIAVEKNTSPVVGSWTNGIGTFTFVKDGTGTIAINRNGTHLSIEFEWRASEKNEGTMQWDWSQFGASPDTVVPTDYWKISGDKLYVFMPGTEYEKTPQEFKRVK